MISECRSTGFHDHPTSLPLFEVCIRLKEFEQAGNFLVILGHRLTFF